MVKKLPEAAVILSDLLKAVLWQKYPELDYSYVSGVTWRQVYKLSKLQGVRGLALDGVARLPEALQPDEELLLAWAANARLLEERALRYQQEVAGLNRLFSVRSVDMLLLKGMGLAAFYPEPLHREYGDVDIYLYGQHDEGDRCLSDWGATTKDVPKHSVFRFRGIPVENHRTFIDIPLHRDIFYRKRRRTIEHMEESLHEILRQEGTCSIGNEEIRVPSATFNFIFMTMHAATHLPDELVVRHLCDWACFLSANKGKYDERKIKAVLENTNFGKLASAMTCAAIHYLGMPADCAPRFFCHDVDERLTGKLLRALFYHFPSPSQVARNTLRCKWKRFLSKQWKYDLVYREYLFERLCRTMLLWIKQRI